MNEPATEPASDPAEPSEAAPPYPQMAQDVHAMLLTQGQRLGLDAPDHWLECTVMPDDEGKPMVLFERTPDREGRCALPDTGALELLLQLEPDHLEPRNSEMLWLRLRAHEGALFGDALHQAAHWSIDALEVATRMCQTFNVPADIAAWRETRAYAFHAARDAAVAGRDPLAAARDVVRDHAKTARKVQRAVKSAERKQRKRGQPKARPKKH